MRLHSVKKRATLSWISSTGEFMKRIIRTDKAPEAIGPYSQAIEVKAPSSFLFLSGQIPLDPVTGAMVSGSIEEETRQALTNLMAVVEAAGYTLQDVVKTTVFLTDIGHFGSVNQVYAEYFRSSLPARATVAVRELPKQARVEVEAVCFK